MAGNNRPTGRQKKVSGQGKDIYKRGEGLGTGPVGSPNGYTGRPQSSKPQSNRPEPTPISNIVPNQQGTARPSGSRGLGKGGIGIIAVIALLVIFGGKFGLGNLLGGGSDTPANQSNSGTSSPLSGITDLLSGDVSGLLSGFTGNLSGGSVSSGWTQGDNTKQLNTKVAKGVRDRFTTIKGKNKDVVTIMVYMCGTDLESKSGMATADLTEMTKATIGKNVNLIVYTGGCTRWNNNIVSSSVNQIYKVENGGIKLLEKDMGSDAMTNPTTLSTFIKWCAKKYPANRNMLIFWDHGGGSVSGYGYDEKNARSGSMTLSGINKALKAGGIKYDIIGFDACLMATAENALMLSDYADYMIASEETEPGVGWYYTDWLTELSNNTSMASVEIGKNIADSFVEECNAKCAGQKTTLSVVDLAELAETAPVALKAYANNTSDMISSGDYKAVSNARAGAREFAASNRIDQVDLVDLAYNTGTKEGKALAETLKSAIKYNRTSSNMTNAYGLSIYFPYSSTKNVQNAVSTYDAIGLDDDYSECIEKFASLQLTGQATAQSTTPSSSPLSSLMPSLLGSFLGGGSSSSSSSSSSLLSSDMISSVLGGLISGGSSSSSSSSSSSLLSTIAPSVLSGLTSSFFGKSMPMDAMSAYVAENQFDASYLTWQKYGNQKAIAMPEENWELVDNILLNVFYDDGEGFIDLGLDNVFDWTEEGYLLGEYDGTWLALDEQPVPYYYIDTVDDGETYSITGRVPVLLNGERADLILVFDNAHPDGYVAGTRFDYKNGETDTIAKLGDAPAAGDTIDFICDYYTYEGEYSDSYLMGDQMICDGELSVSNVYINAEYANAAYRFTDIYAQDYWTPVMD